MGLSTVQKVPPLSVGGVQRGPLQAEAFMVLLNVETIPRDRSKTNWMVEYATTERIAEEATYF
jgi:hypothetical protein